MKKIVLLIISFVFLFGCESNMKNQKLSKSNFKKKEVTEKMSELKATIKTTKGEININLFPEVAPITVSNFVNLATKGYYDGLDFHRVIEDFMIQGGCPLGTGTGGPGYQFEDECSSEARFDKSGKLAMANSGPGTNGSQFFITHIATTWLQGKHTIFGEVVSEADQKIVDAIQQGDLIEAITIEGDYAELLESNKDKVAEWNTVLDK